MNPNALTQSVAEIILDVSQRGDRALIDCTERFDQIKLTPQTLLIPQKSLAAAYKKIPQNVRETLRLVYQNIEHFHREELKQICKFWQTDRNGLRVGQRALPLEKVGIYVPGGRFPYPSTVLMTAIPAKVAGVRQVVMVTPPKNLRDEILAAAYLAKVNVAVRVGGPAAIAALAYGTETVPQVDKIVGPGNRFVTEAKRQVFGLVGIDGLAGPSEIAIWAGKNSNIEKIISNLLAQAEHDPDSVAALFTLDKNLIQMIKNAMKNKVSPAMAAQIRLELCASDDEIAQKINAMAPEHLILALSKARSFLPKIKNAGAIFLGENTPVPLGDYAAGPSHVLPTAASARFNSGLSVRDFMKWNSLIETRSLKSAQKTFQAAQTLADIEGLHYHSKALKSV